MVWNWIRGHAGHRENEECDRMAVAAAREAARRPVARPQAPPGQRSRRRADETDAWRSR